MQTTERDSQRWRFGEVEADMRFKSGSRLVNN